MTMRAVRHENKSPDVDAPLPTYLPQPSAERHNLNLRCHPSFRQLNVVFIISVSIVADLLVVRNFSPRPVGQVGPWTRSIMQRDRRPLRAPRQTGGRDAKEATVASWASWMTGPVSQRRSPIDYAYGTNRSGDDESF
ncbi:hypothetical protein GWI33_003089 [Rhynchophorus ferrugineus]|uniref:Uncharacterized protein n=1 Tax=Rhynchophorus ferrugineus TaxID=354439 RepID=A0A834MJ88_RHYFE|nr:hypothetical protein GWI33_003089 [Rhynchophorus ferrugineus]